MMRRSSHLAIVFALVGLILPGQSRLAIAGPGSGKIALVVYNPHGDWIERQFNGLYLLDPSTNQAPQLILPGASQDELHRLTLEHQQDKEGALWPRRPDGSIDPHRLFLPYANSSVALSPNGRYLAVSGLVVRQDHQRLADQAIAEPNHYRIILVDLVGLADAKKRQRAVLTIFDTFDYVYLNGGTYQLTPQLPVIPLADQLPFQLASEFDSNPHVAAVSAMSEQLQKSETFQWGDGARLQLSFSPDSKRLYLRVFQSPFREEIGFFGSKSFAPISIGEIKDFGVHRSFALNIETVMTFTGDITLPQYFEYIRSNVDIRRTVVPNQPYLTASSALKDRRSFATFILSPDGQMLVTNHLQPLKESEASTTWFQTYDQTLFVQRQCDPILSPFCTNGNLQTLVSVRADHRQRFSLLTPFMRWLDEHLVVRRSDLDLQLFSRQQLEQALTTAATSRTNIDPSTLTPDQARAMLRGEAPRLNVTPFATTYDPTLSMHGVNVDPRLGKSLRLGTTPIDVAWRQGNLVVVSGIRTLPQVGNIRQIPPRYPNERSEHDHFSGFATLYDFNRGQMRYALYPRWQEPQSFLGNWLEGDKPIHHLWEELSSTKDWLQQPYWDANRPYHPDSSPGNLTHAQDVLSWLAGSMRSPWIDSSLRFLYFLERRLPPVSQRAADDVAEALAELPWPLLSRVPLAHPCDCQIERLGEQGWVSDALIQDTSHYPRWLPGVVAFATVQ